MLESGAEHTAWTLGNDSASPGLIIYLPCFLLDEQVFPEHLLCAGRCSRRVSRDQPHLVEALSLPSLSLGRSPHPHPSSSFSSPHLCLAVPACPSSLKPAALSTREPSMAPGERGLVHCRPVRSPRARAPPPALALLSACLWAQLTVDSQQKVHENLGRARDQTIWCAGHSGHAAEVSPASKPVSKGLSRRRRVCGRKTQSCLGLL